MARTDPWATALERKLLTTQTHNGSDVDVGSAVVDDVGSAASTDVESADVPLNAGIEWPLLRERGDAIEIRSAVCRSTSWGRFYETVSAAYGYILIWSYLSS
jgi:hypothetical protein